MKDYSIEYAHIYTNEQIEEEHKFSLEVLDGAKHKLTDKSLALVVMVDDYSFPDPTFDYNDFTNWLKEHNNKPDLVMRESQLIPVCDEVLKIIEDEKIKNELVEYVKKKKYPCSLFIAAWYLVRLGKLQHEIFPTELAADNLINILPESFRPYEDRGIDIIKATPHREVANKIHNEYFLGRKI